MNVPKIKATHVVNILVNKVGITDKKGNKQQFLLNFDDERIDWNSFLLNAELRNLTIQYGQDYDLALKLQNGKSLHMHIYTKKRYMLCHIDNYCSDNSAFMHLHSDTSARKGISPGLLLSLWLARTYWEVFAIMSISTGIAALRTTFSRNIFTFGSYKRFACSWKIRIKKI